jgi:hypothetical protein
MEMLKTYTIFLKEGEPLVIQASSHILGNLDVLFIGSDSTDIRAAVPRANFNGLTITELPN